MVEKTLESSLDCKEIKPVNPKGNQPWIFIGRTDVEAEIPILWPSDAKNWLTGKFPDAGKDWRQEENETIEDEMVGWHHWLNGHEFEQAPPCDGQGNLVCCSPLGCKESGTTERLNWTVSRVTCNHLFPFILLPSRVKKISLSWYRTNKFKSTYAEYLLLLSVFQMVDDFLPWVYISKPPVYLETTSLTLPTSHVNAIPSKHDITNQWQYYWAHISVQSAICILSHLITKQSHK